MLFTEASLYLLADYLKQTQRTMRQREGKCEAKRRQPANQIFHDHFLRLRAEPLAYIIDFDRVGYRVHPFAVAVRTWVWQYRATIFGFQPPQAVSFTSKPSIAEGETGFEFIECLT